MLKIALAQLKKPKRFLLLTCSSRTHLSRLFNKPKTVKQTKVNTLNQRYTHKHFLVYNFNNLDQSKSTLNGKLYTLKDNFCTKSIRTTCGSKMLETFVPPYNATIIERLLKSGAILLGKTNMDEYKQLFTSESEYFQLKLFYSIDLEWDQLVQVILVQLKILGDCLKMYNQMTFL